MGKDIVKNTTRGTNKRFALVTFFFTRGFTDNGETKRKAQGCWGEIWNRAADSGDRFCGEYAQYFIWLSSSLILFELKKN